MLEIGYLLVLTFGLQSDFDFQVDVTFNASRVLGNGLPDTVVSVRRGSRGTRMVTMRWSLCRGA